MNTDFPTSSYRGLPLWLQIKIPGKNTDTDWKFAALSSVTDFWIPIKNPTANL